MVCPDGKVVPMDVKGDIPYLRRNGQFRDPSSQDKSVELCGVSTADGVLIVQHTLPTAEHAAAAPARDADDGSDSVFDAGSDAPVPLVPRDCDSDFGSEPDATTDVDRDPIPVVHDDLEEAMHACDVHCLTHKPARNKDCADCMRGKTRNRRKLTGAFSRQAQEFGDLITMDHIHMRDVYGRAGFGGVCWRTLHL